MAVSETLWAVAGFWLLAAAAPGPNMLLFASIALSSGRAAVFGAGLGIIAGTGTLALAGLLGMFWILEAFPAVALALRIGGAAYIAWSGFWLLWGGVRPAAAASAAPGETFSPKRAFVIALLTNLSNAKSLFFLSSLFAATRLAEKPLAVGLAGVAIIVSMSAVFYVLLGLAVSRAARGRSVSGAGGRALKIAAGAAMTALGAKLALGR